MNEDIIVFVILLVSMPVSCFIVALYSYHRGKLAGALEEIQMARKFLRDSENRRKS